MNKMDLNKIETEFGIKLPYYVKKWIAENWGQHQASKRITITSRGYNKSLKFLIEKGIIKRYGIFPHNGYGESFGFTKKIFPERESITISDIRKIEANVNAELKEMGLL